MLNKSSFQREISRSARRDTFVLDLETDFLERDHTALASPTRQIALGTWKKKREMKRIGFVCVCVCVCVCARASRQQESEISAHTRDDDSRESPRLHERHGHAILLTP